MKPALVNNKYEVTLPDEIADWDAITGWELSRFESMLEIMQPGKVLADIGTEHGWISAVLAQHIGGENMCLFEPSPEFWVNIRKTWEANGLANPRSIYIGLLDNETIPAAEQDFDAELVDGWPRCSWADEETPAMPYRYIHNEKHVVQTPRIKFDDWVTETGIIPDYLTIDIEGAELRFLQGAEQFLRNHAAIVWVSIHPDLLERDYGTTKQQVLDFMFECGYVRQQHLGTDHEQHWLMQKK